MSHSPPRGLVDWDSSGNHLGSSALADAVNEKDPRLVVCGHIHTCWRKQASCGATDVINAGPQGLEWHLR